MDQELTFHELGRLEAERKLRAIPEDLLQTAWVREAQIEAVIDAVLAVTLGADALAYAHARHTGEWCARIAAGLPFGPDQTFARRVGVLCETDPNALERIPELAHFAGYVRDYQRYAIEGPDSPSTMSLIVATADEFDSRVSPGENDASVSPQRTLRAMLAASDELSRPILETLAQIVHPSKNARVA